MSQKIEKIESIVVRAKGDLRSVAQKLDITIPPGIVISERDLRFSARFQPINPDGLVIIDDNGSVDALLKKNQKANEEHSLISTPEEFLASILKAKSSGRKMPDTIVAKSNKPGLILCYTDSDLTLRELRSDAPLQEGASIAFIVTKAKKTPAKKPASKKSAKATKAA